MFEDMDESGPLTQAREALRLAQIDPARSVQVAGEAIAQARGLRQWDAASVAERAFGLALVHLQDLTAAHRHLRTAMALAHRGGFTELEAEARITFAGALNRSGQPQRALTEIGTALDGLSNPAHARGLFQRAAILQQLGHLDEALADYRTALPSLRRADDLLGVQRVLLNRGLLHAFKHAYGAALRDLHEAQRLCDQLRLTLPAAFVHENLVLVHRRLGDVPQALEHLELAEQIYASVGTPKGSLLVERSELLLSVGLFTESREAAQVAVEEFTRAGRHLSTPEARLLLVRTSVLSGDPRAAVTQARRAAREFKAQSRTEWAVLADCAALLAKMEVTDGPPVRLKQLTDAAQRAEDYGWPVAALDLRLLAGRSNLTGRSRTQARELLRMVGSARHRGPASRRAKAWFATALLRRDDGRLRSSSTAAARGLDILDDHRSTLTATDLRARVSALGVDLALVGQRNALASGSPEQLLWWAERGRARHLLERPALPPGSPGMAQLMAELRSVVAEQTERQSAGQSVRTLVQRQETLEHAIRDASRREASPLVPLLARPDHTARSDPTARSDHAARTDHTALAAALGAAALVEFLELDGRLYALCVVDGRTTRHDLGSVARLRDLVRWLPFALLRLSRRTTTAASAAAAVDLLQRLGAELDQRLLRPMAPLLGDRDVVLVPTGLLQSLPWSLLPSLVGRPTVVAPSAGIWMGASVRAPRSGAVVVVSGPGLPGADEEARVVAAMYDVVPLTGAAATVDAVTTALRDASMVHLAAHGSVRADNPLFSSLRLVDGPLTVYDLERLDSEIGTVVLAACESGRDVVWAGDEVLGLSAAFLARGTRQVVASVVPIPDAATSVLMSAFHRRLAAGAPAARALAEAQAAVDPEDISALAAAVGFVCIGGGLSSDVPGAGSV